MLLYETFFGLTVCGLFTQCFFVSNILYTNVKYLYAVKSHQSNRFFCFSGICLAIGIIAFPLGWDNDHIRSICGQTSDDYSLVSHLTNLHVYGIGIDFKTLGDIWHSLSHFMGLGVMINFEYGVA